jgi:hypothetical protein
MFSGLLSRFIACDYFTTGSASSTFKIKIFRSSILAK